MNQSNDMTQFGPIRLGNVIYRIIAKVVVNKFRVVFDSYIDGAQATFVLRRQITNNVLTAYEILQSLK